MSVFNNQRQANIRVVFRKFDKDSDGFITVKDLINVFRELGEDVREDEMREHFHNAGRGHGCEKGISISMIFYCSVKRCNCKVKEVTGYFSANHIIEIFYHFLITIRSH